MVLGPPTPWVPGERTCREESRERCGSLGTSQHPAPPPRPRGAGGGCVGSITVPCTLPKSNTSRGWEDPSFVGSATHPHPSDWVTHLHPTLTVPASRTQAGASPPPSHGALLPGPVWLLAPAPASSLPHAGSLTSLTPSASRTDLCCPSACWDACPTHALWHCRPSGLAKVGL